MTSSPITRIRRMIEKVQYYETVISLVTTDLGLWYLVGGGWQGAFYYETQGAVEGSRYLFSTMRSWSWWCVGAAWGSTSIQTLIL